ncbi:hypothetical protein Pmani_005165 [Petrolisthes manimaculis]|uniref:Uncharacterized protein n=1 Tax=Petrolisthes manimaculis TaxID=1843537 RepID=A0AAE1QFG2_9EUCA|nr:hypothetical protein Pmani_005165 [Petrolisthes manimaculis]
MIDVVPVKQKRMEAEVSRRSVTRVYHVSYNNIRTKVCLPGFMAMHNITKKRIDNAIRKMTQTATPLLDLRGRHKPANKIEGRKADHKDYSHNKAGRTKTGGGPPPKPGDPVSAAVLPLLKEELESLGTEWDSDQRHHENNVLENTENGTVIPVLSVTAVEIDEPEERRTSTPVPNGDPVTTREEPSTSKGNIKCLKKKKLASREKQEALKLTSERKYLLREMDLELHRKRLELIDYEKKLITSYYEGQRELQQLQKRLLIEKHTKEISTPQQ